MFGDLDEGRLVVVFFFVIWRFFKGFGKCLEYFFSNRWVN